MKLGAVPRATKVWGGWVVILSGAMFALLAAPSAGAQCQITPVCDWCECTTNSDGDLVCRCYNCTLACPT